MFINIYKFSTDLKDVELLAKQNKSDGMEESKGIKNQDIQTIVKIVSFVINESVLE